MDTSQKPDGSAGLADGHQSNTKRQLVGGAGSKDEYQPDIATPPADQADKTIRDKVLEVAADYLKVDSLIITFTSLFLGAPSTTTLIYSGKVPSAGNPFYHYLLTFETMGSNIVAYFKEADEWLGHWQMTVPEEQIQVYVRKPTSKLNQILQNTAFTLSLIHI